MEASFEMEEQMDIAKQVDNPKNGFCSKFFQGPIHVEIAQKQQSGMTPEQLEFPVKRFLRKQMVLKTDYQCEEFAEPVLKEHVQCISLSDVNCTQIQGGASRPSDGTGICPQKVNFVFHVYKLNEDGPGFEEFEEEELSAANHWLLPSLEFHGLWESLVYDSDIKSHLVSFVSTTILFSDRKVDSNVISCNRVVLLHGPPGTGKTSLCKALAQKLSIRLGHRYSYGQLIEINSHSLFSKWFSESGKLVMRLFQKIQELIEDPRGLVFVLIDEVESLAHARNACGSEPSDSIRVVNALLTQIDQLRRFPNVIVLTTSNMTEAIDLAFVDRADVKRYVGLPGTSAIYQIYRSAVEELERVLIIDPKHPIVPLSQLNVTSESDGDIPFFQCSRRLLSITAKSVGLSGRTLRKLPFLAQALYVQSEKCTITQFLNALEKAVERQFEEVKTLKKSAGDVQEYKKTS